MTYIVILIVYLAGLFVVAWLSRRQMALPALALAAGALMAELWTSSLTPIVAEAGVELVRPPLTSVVAVGLTLLPALLVMFRAPRARGGLRSLVSCLVFAVLAAMLTYGAFSGAVVLDDASRQYALDIIRWQNVVITAAIALVLLEIVFARSELSRKKK